VKYPCLAMPDGTLHERLKHGLSAKAHASRTRLIRRCSVGYTHCWMFVTEDDLSLTQRLWYYYLYPCRREPAQPPANRGQFDLCSRIHMECAYAFHRQILFPLSHASYFGKRRTATLTCCLQPCGWVATIFMIA